MAPIATIERHTTMGYTVATYTTSSLVAVFAFIEILFGTVEPFGTWTRVTGQIIDNLYNNLVSDFDDNRIDNRR